jgi:c-di-GMP-binding flagellar brake protein YcgR
MEKRRYKRYALDVYDIHSEMLFAKEVNILDISMSGVSLKADKRMDINREYTLKIKSKEQILILKGKVIWSLLSGNQRGARGDSIPIYTAGLSFTDIAPEKMREILDFIEGHKREEDRQEDVYQLSGLRLFTRFQIQAPEETSLLHCYDGCKVKKLSLGGMLIESGNPLEIENTMPMQLTFPQEKSITFKGRIASCLQIENAVPESYDVGVEFLEMSEEDKKILVEFIQSLEMEHSP